MEHHRIQDNGTTTGQSSSRPTSTWRRLLWFAAIWAGSLIAFAVVVYSMRWLLAP